MKGFVAVTCIAVLAAVGYYFWSEYSDGQATAQATARIEGIREELFALAKAEESDVEAVKKYCRSSEIGLTVPSLKQSHELWLQVTKNCRFLGYL